MNPKVTHVVPMDEYALGVVFGNGEARTFDVKPYLEMGIFVELKDPVYFRSVRVVAGSVEWPHGQDFSYDTLYIAGTPCSPDSLSVTMEQ